MDTLVDHRRPVADAACWVFFTAVVNTRIGGFGIGGGWWPGEQGDRGTGGGGLGAWLGLASVGLNAYVTGNLEPSVGAAPARLRNLPPSPSDDGSPVRNLKIGTGNVPSFQDMGWHASSQFTIIPAALGMPTLRGIRGL